jgi:hypothetical protein
MGVARIDQACLRELKARNQGSYSRTGLFVGRAYPTSKKPTQPQSCQPCP